MVFKRSSRRRPTRKTQSGGGWKSHLGSALSLATTAGVKYARKRLGLNPENKNYDTTAAGFVTSTTAAAFLSPVAGLAQGTTNNSRTGNGLRVTHLTCRGWLNSGAGNFNDQQVRLIVTYMPALTTPGTTVTPTQLLQTSNDINSPYNSDLEGVRVIYDKRFKLSCSSANSIASQGFLPFKIKWSPSYDLGHVQWTDGDVGGLTANIVKGNIYIWVMCSDPGPAPILSAYCRVNFVDN